MKDKILIIYTKKETKAYDRYEIYPLNENLTKDIIIEKIKEYNADTSKDLTAKIYDDPILLDFVSDVQSSFQYKTLINSLKSICRDVEDSISDLESWQDEIETLLRKEKENAR